MSKTTPKSTKKERPDAERRLRQNVRIARVLRILELIQGKSRWNAPAIAEAIECSERTVYRDLAALEIAGVPWYYDEVEQSYRVRPSFRFPTVNLTADELLDQATATIVAEAHGMKLKGAKATTIKLAATADDNAKLLEDVQRLTAVLDLKLADHSRHQEAIKTVQWALLKGKQLVGNYVTPYRDKPVRLTLHPYRLCLAGQSWYLIARPNDQETPKTYRVPRFQSLRAIDRPAVVPEHFDLRSYFDNAWTVFRGDTTYDIEIEFTAEAAPLVTETQWHHTQKVNKQYKDGRIVLAFRVDGLDEIVWWVLGWSGRAKVLGPDELRRRVVAQLEVALRLNRA